jgi:antitoxin component of MazEF toxin-antitoxin module
VSEAERAEVDAVVGPAGDLVIPRDAVRQLELVPGQQVLVSVTPRRLRRNMYGVLAGRLSDVDQDDIRRVRREVWGDLAADP